MNAAEIAKVLGKARKGTDGWISCLCPAHNDKDPSLSIKDGRNGAPLVKCHAGCDNLSVIAALKERRLWPERKPRKEIAATYGYRDEAGIVRYEVVRYANPKTFRQRRPDARGGWIWNMNGVEPLPYRLPELIGSGKSIVFVAEGEKDCIHLAAIDEVATCNHGGAEKWSPKINRYFAGRDIIILPDNDEAGCRHAQKVAAQLHPVAKRLRILALSSLPEKGDVSDWIAGGGTSAELHRLAEAAPAWEPTQDAAPVLDPSDPLPIARSFVERVFKKDGEPLLRHHAGDFYLWRKNHYAIADDADVDHALYGFLDKARRPKNNGTAPFQPNRSKVENVLHALRACVHISSRVTPPAWLDDGPVETVPIIACANGLLRLTAPDPELIPNSPKFFNTSAIEFDYDAAAPQPVEWLKFLASLWGEDKQSIEALQEIFGCIAAADQRFQKMFLLVGPKRSGKGTIGRILTKLVGKGGHAGLTLASLSKNFGLQPLINKTLTIVPDARLHGSAHEIVERLLAISGGDTLTIDRKYRDAWTGRVPTQFMFLTNVLPALADSSGAIASRFIILVLIQSFFGREDLELESRLLCELPGILNWAIAGWRRLNERGRFVQPESAGDCERVLNELASPVKAFLNECCALDPNMEIETGKLFDAWSDWCEQNGREHPGNAASFGRDLRAALPTITLKQHRAGDRMVRVYVGIRLRDMNQPW